MPNLPSADLMFSNKGGDKNVLVTLQFLSVLGNLPRTVNLSGPNEVVVNS